MADATELLNEIESLPDKVLRLAASSMFAVHKMRIFGKGEATDGSDIGSYSTKPAYFNPNDFPKRFTPEGKDGDKGPIGDKPRKTKYFEDGYSGVRKETGRRNDKVDLRMTGTLEQSYQAEREGNSVVYGFVFKLSGKKAEGAEERFDKPIFEVSKKERELFSQVVEAET